jgi:hypothetical protein
MVLDTHILWTISNTHLDQTLTAFSMSTSHLEYLQSLKQVLNQCISKSDYQTVFCDSRMDLLRKVISIPPVTDSDTEVFIDSLDAFSQSIRHLSQAVGYFKTFLSTTAIPMLKLKDGHASVSCTMLVNAIHAGIHLLDDTGVNDAQLLLDLLCCFAESLLSSNHTRKQALLIKVFETQNVCVHLLLDNGKHDLLTEKLGQRLVRVYSEVLPLDSDSNHSFVQLQYHAFLGLLLWLPKVQWNWIMKDVTQLIKMKHPKLRPLSLNVLSYCPSLPDTLSYAFHISTDMFEPLDLRLSAFELLLKAEPQEIIQQGSLSTLLDSLLGLMTRKVPFFCVKAIQCFLTLLLKFPKEMKDLFMSRKVLSILLSLLEEPEFEFKGSLVNQLFKRKQSLDQEWIPLLVNHIMHVLYVALHHGYEIFSQLFKGLHGIDALLKTLQYPLNAHGILFLTETVSFANKQNIPIVGKLNESVLQRWLRILVGLIPSHEKVVAQSLGTLFLMDGWMIDQELKKMDLLVPLMKNMLCHLDQQYSLLMIYVSHSMLAKKALIQCKCH